MNASRDPALRSTRAVAKRLALLIPPIRLLYEEHNRLLSRVTNLTTETNSRAEAIAALEARVAELEALEAALKSTIAELEARGVASAGGFAMEPAAHSTKPALIDGHPSFQKVYSFCETLKRNGWVPDFVLDVGASTGIWSGLISEVFPDAAFVLCDPLFDRYPEVWLKPGMVQFHGAVADKPGRATFTVSSDLYGSSMIATPDVADTVTVDVTTVDSLVSRFALKGRGLLKADVQFAEHLIIEGASNALANHIDVVILELTVTNVSPQSRSLLENANRLHELGFRFADIVGEWRQPETQEAVQFDVAFRRY
jgi:FkbM family methyltransferase